MVLTVAEKLEAARLLEKLADRYSTSLNEAERSVYLAAELRRGAEKQARRAEAHA